MIIRTTAYRPTFRSNMLAVSFHIDKVAQVHIMANAMQHFSEKCEIIHRDMVWLLDKTSVPDDAASTNGRVADAIRALDNILKFPDNNVHLRLAYVQLTRMLAALKERIKHDRGQGRLAGKSSQRHGCHQSLL